MASEGRITSKLEPFSHASGTTPRGRLFHFEDHENFLACASSKKSKLKELLEKKLDGGWA